MGAKGRDPKLEKFWRSALRRRKRSGLTVAAFCEQEGLSPTTYHFWRREIKRRDEQQQAKNSTPAASNEPTLVPVQLIEDRGSAPVEIVGPSGLVIRVPEEATTEHVRRILQLVREVG